MIQNKARNGNFTSSEIVALTKLAKDKVSFGAPALTYIDETNMERRLGRSLTDEVNAKPLTWGKLLESRVHELLGLEYVLTSDVTDIHPSIPYWAGSKDGIKYDEGKTVTDIKCPITLKSFCQLVDPLYAGLAGIDAMIAIRDGWTDRAGIEHAKHVSGEKYYWQLVSNSILNNTKYAELIVYMPYKSEIQSVRMMADGQPNAYWIAMASDDELPFLTDGGYYKNINTIRFEVPESDKKLLTEKVLKAGKMLIPYPNELPAPDESTEFEMVAQLDKEVKATIVHDENALII